MSAEESTTVNEKLEAVTDALAEMVARMKPPPADPVLDPIIEEAVWALHEVSAVQVARQQRAKPDAVLVLYPPTDDHRMVLRMYMQEAVAASKAAADPPSATP